MDTCVDRLPLPADAATVTPGSRTGNIRVGIVGCGRVAEQCHIPAALAASEVELVALADSNHERLDRIASAFDLSCFSTVSASDLIGRVDGVVISLPNHLHHPLASEFLKAGVHVLCEKPLATTTRDARDLCELAEDRGLVLAVGYMKRFEPNSALMKRLLERGFLGRLDRFEFEYGTAGGWAPLSNYNLSREQSGGGVLVTNGSHLLDRIIDWFGYPSRVAYSDDAHGGVEANCRATFRYESGLSGTLTLSKTRQLENQFSLHGERGRIVIGASQHSSVTFFPAEEPGLRHEIAPHPAPRRFSDGDYFRLQLEDFATAIRAGRSPRVSGKDGLPSVELIEHCYRVGIPCPEPWVTQPIAAVTRSLGTGTDGAGGSARGAGTILVTGATGFVGSRLCEVLHVGTSYRPRAFLRSSGQAAYIARYPLELSHGDLTNFASVRRAMEGCSSVVHLARGSDDVMIEGLKNVLRAAVEAKVRRFVHVSSVAVYGDNPQPSARDETAVPMKTGNPYGDIKLAQEQLVIACGQRHGLPFVILRPPHIFGPSSHFVRAVVDRLRRGALAIVNDGSNICNLVYVDNFIQAILLSLETPEAVGETFFITDRERVTWRKCLGGLGEIIGVDVPHASKDQLFRPARPRAAVTLRRLAGALLAPEFRAAAMDLPGAPALANLLYRPYAALPEKRRARISAALRPQSSRTMPFDAAPRYDAGDYLILSQQRTVVHSSEKAERLLGYSAPVGYDEAMSLTRAWIHGLQPLERVA